MSAKYSNIRVKSDPDEEMVDAKEEDLIVADDDIDDAPQDRVVQEMDVYVSPSSLSSKLYLIQYPLQVSTVEMEEPLEARIKPKHGMLELEHPIPSNIGREGSYFIGKRTFSSTTIPVETHLGLCQINRKTKTVHLVPLEHIKQMRPSFAHVDEETGPSDAEVPNPAAAEKPKERKPLLFQKKESERASLARRSSYAFKKQSQDSEEWYNLRVCSGESSREREAVLSSIEQSTQTGAAKAGKSEQDEDNDAHPTDASTRRFVESLNYLPGGGGDQDEGMDDDNVERLLEDDDDDTMKRTRRAPGTRPSPLIKTVQKVMALMAKSKGSPMPYSILRLSLLGHFVRDDADALKAIASCCVLLQMQGSVERRRLEQIMEHEEPTEDENGNGNLESSGWLDVMLNQVAKRSRSQSCWVLKLGDNHQFCLSFPEHVALHNQYWDRQTKHLHTYNELYMSGEDDEEADEEDEEEGNGEFVKQEFA